MSDLKLFNGQRLVLTVRKPFVITVDVAGIFCFTDDAIKGCNCLFNAGEMVGWR